MANCLQASAFSAAGAFVWRTRISARSFSAGELWLSAAVAAWAGITGSTQASRAARTKPRARRRATQASARNCTHLKPLGLFPLTPALSPGERENCRQSVGEAEGAGDCETRPLRLPLLWGEGWG